MTDENEGSILDDIEIIETADYLERCHIIIVLRTIQINNCNRRNFIKIELKTSINNTYQAQDLCE